ncbi:hypothetical protein A8C56_22220 [Niabella ginsenosidivorans]|uniref:HEPN domain-containing protein n=1 Tax=Niabella ginsenosidivorans TaxID=1176587 RepID=A0A1A9I6U3_9BACT|nr:HEPN domain-containing protein [Niabella ginsenosidivorans]ANH83336.1 hypothetical protein A8C56_22220 [Niabella ginsenosidivorans]
MSSVKHLSVQQKLRKAHALFNEVETLIQFGYYTTAVNRLYYACFHAVKALLLTKDLIPKTHSGTVALLHKHFVQAQLFDIQQASFYSRIMQERIDDDYNDFILTDKDEVNSFVSPAKELIAYIERLIDITSNEY